jgi:acetyl esterase
MPALFRAFFVPAILITMVQAATALGSQTVQSRSIQNIEYAQVDGVSLRLDASLPQSSTKTPAVIIVHGGGWVRGDRRFDVQPLFEPLTQAGFAWFSIDYRLATDLTQFGVAVADVQAAIRYVKAHAVEYNIDVNRLALIGESAGGQLASLAILRGGEDVSVQAFVGIYTPTDLVSLVKNSNYVPAQFRNSIQGTPWESLVLAGLSQLSPIENVRKGVPPFLLIHGTSDSLVPFAQSQQMCDRMRQAGASCEVYAVRGAGHGLRWWESNPNLTEYKTKMVDWLRQTLFRS